VCIGISLNIHLKARLDYAKAVLKGKAAFAPLVTLKVNGVMKVAMGGEIERGFEVVPGTGLEPARLLGTGS
jgi:hypothetical protein